MLVPPLDINALGNFYQNNCLEKIMKIGWGTGLLGTTIALFLKDNDKLTLRRDGVPVHVLEILRDEVIHQVPVKKGRFVPKSSRVILNSEQKPEYPLGWVKLEEIR
jgi:CRISPR/Cas system CSM-associated protein Csm5 (group 7 of RAMP superfamily)